MNGPRRIWEQYQHYRRSREPRRLWERIAEWDALFQIVFIVGIFFWGLVSLLFHRWGR
jgi:hypothetical protein